jgi:hypothetical protein
MEKNDKEFTLEDMINHFDTVSRYGAKRGQPSGMYGKVAVKLRRLEELEGMIERGELVRREDL